MASFIGSSSSFTSSDPGPSSSSQSQQSQASAGSTTTTSHSQSSQPVLRLRGVRPPRRSIRWAEDVVDNEGLGRKSSKVCCIFHPTRPVGESSDESSSSSSSSSSDEDSAGEGNVGPRRFGHGRVRRVSRRNPRHDDCGHRHHENGTHHGHEHAATNDINGDAQQTRRRHSPNAYERMPKTNKVRKGGGGTMTEVVRQ